MSAPEQIFSLAPRRALLRYAGIWLLGVAWALLHSGRSTADAIESALFAGLWTSLPLIALGTTRIVLSAAGIAAAPYDWRFTGWRWRWEPKKRLWFIPWEEYTGWRWEVDGRGRPQALRFARRTGEDVRVDIAGIQPPDEFLLPTIIRQGFAQEEGARAGIAERTRRASVLQALLTAIEQHAPGKGQLPAVEPAQRPSVAEKPDAPPEPLDLSMRRGTAPSEGERREPLVRVLHALPVVGRWTIIACGLIAMACVIVACVAQLRKLPQLLHGPLTRRVVADLSDTILFALAVPLLLGRLVWESRRSPAARRVLYALSALACGLIIWAACITAFWALYLSKLHGTWARPEGREFAGIVFSIILAGLALMGQLLWKSLRSRAHRQTRATGR
jgi:hypothetical protein